MPQMILWFISSAVKHIFSRLQSSVESLKHCPLLKRTYCFLLRLCSAETLLCWDFALLRLCSAETLFCWDFVLLRLCSTETLICCFFESHLLLVFSPTIFLTFLLLSFLTLLNCTCRRVLKHTYVFFFAYPNCRRRKIGSIVSLIYMKKLSFISFFQATHACMALCWSAECCCLGCYVWWSVVFNMPCMFWLWVGKFCLHRSRA